MSGIKVIIPILTVLDKETPNDYTARVIQKDGFAGIPEGTTAKLYALDEQGMGGHYGARICGGFTSCELWDAANDDGSWNVRAEAEIMPDDFGIRVANLIDRGLLTGMSIDLADDYAVQYVEEYDSDTGEWNYKVVFTESACAGGTLCEKPAFPEASIRLAEPLPDEYKLSVKAEKVSCDGCDDDHPCTECDANMAAVKAKADAIEAELQAIVASAATVTQFVRVKEERYTPPEILTYADELFENPRLRQLTPYHYDSATGRIKGHLAGWRSPHGALPNFVCPPKSASGYRYFANQQVHLKSGGKAWVGRLVCNTVHAKIRGINAETAMAHYTTTGSVFGLVAVGEDEHGIWISGAAVKMDPEMLALALACPPSGDWRHWPGLVDRELIAGLAVPVPGFNTPQVEFAADGPDTGLIVSNVPVSANVNDTGALDPKLVANIEKIAAFAERSMEREMAEDRMRRKRQLAAAFAVS